MPVLAESDLRQFAVRLLQAAGVPEVKAMRVALSLVEANLRGHDSHGVMRIPYYVEQIEQGHIQPKSSIDVRVDTPGSVVGDGGWGLGQVITHELVDLLIGKCRNSAVVAGTLQRTAHTGRLGEYAEKFAAAGLASIIMANTHGAAQRVAPPGGTAPRLGTNPLCLGMPGGERGPFVIDFGTTVVAEGKIRLRRIAGQDVPEGWILDSSGQPTTDPSVLYEPPLGSILPLGGEQGHKGFGLALLIELFCGGLSGGQCAYPNAPASVGNCVWMLAVNPEFFAGIAHLRQEVSQLEHYLRTTPRKDTDIEITLPGDRGLKVRDERLKAGIPIDDANWQKLVQLGKKLGIVVPETGDFLASEN